MLDYLIGLFLLLKLSTEIRFFVIKRRARKSNYDIMEGAEPFLYKKGKTGVLLIHGFSSTPQEMRELGNFLSKRKLTCYCPLLPGHGTKPEKLTLSRWDDWVNSIKQSLEVLDDLCDNIYIVGNSLGGNLSFIVLDEIKRKNINKKIKGVISLGAPFNIKKGHRGRLAYTVFKHFKIFQKKKYDDDVIKKNILGLRYHEVPVICARDILKTIRESKKSLGNINKPVLLIQSKDDTFVAEDSLDYVKENIKSKDVETFWVSGYHVVLLDKDKNKVFDKIYQFIHNR
jgi:carboxylesterase